MDRRVKPDDDGGMRRFAGISNPRLFHFPYPPLIAVLQTPDVRRRSVGRDGRAVVAAPGRRITGRATYGRNPAGAGFFPQGRDRSPETGASQEARTGSVPEKFVRDIKSLRRAAMAAHSQASKARVALRFALSNVEATDAGAPRER